MILSIDTTNTNEVTVSLKDKEGKPLAKLSQSQKKGSQVLMPMIAKILKNNKINLKNIAEIQVNTGPGSFTGTRVGVSVANALGYALNIPVNGKKGKIVEPVYEKSKFDQ